MQGVRDTSILASYPCWGILVYGQTALILLQTYMTALGISGLLPFYKFPAASYVHLLITVLNISISFPFFTRHTDFLLQDIKTRQKSKAWKLSF